MRWCCSGSEECLILVVLAISTLRKFFVDPSLVRCLNEFIRALVQNVEMAIGETNVLLLIDLNTAKPCFSP